MVVKFREEAIDECVVKAKVMFVGETVDLDRMEKCSSRCVLMECHGAAEAFVAVICLFQNLFIFFTYPFSIL